MADDEKTETEEPSPTDDAPSEDQGGETENAPPNDDAPAAEEPSNYDNDIDNEIAMMEEEEEEDERDPCGRTDAEVKWYNEIQDAFAAAMPAILAWNLYRVFKANKLRIEKECKMTPKERERMRRHDQLDMKKILIRNKVAELLDEQSRLNELQRRSMNDAQDREMALKDKLYTLREQSKADRKKMKSLAERIERRHNM